MARGGARNRSGPKADPKSGRSEQRGYRLDELPADGYAGPVPTFPLDEPTDRELEVWEWAWTLPQACAWSMPTEAWRQRTVAMWVRVSVKCEAHEAPASLLAQLHRFADQIGMTTAGLAEMGWKIADTEAKPAKSEASDGTPKRRLRAI